MPDSSELTDITLAKFQCGYTDSQGTRCETIAKKRLHFSANHPFDHLDLCLAHLNEYQNYVWCQPLTEGRLM